jgi:hypothetical protein
MKVACSLLGPGSMDLTLVSNTLLTADTIPTSESLFSFKTFDGQLGQNCQVYLQNAAGATFHCV